MMFQTGGAMRLFEQLEPEQQELALDSEIVSVCGVNPRCDICGRAQQPEDEWNGDTGNHRACEAER